MGTHLQLNLKDRRSVDQAQFPLGSMPFDFDHLLLECRVEAFIQISTLVSHVH
jgi:hypothetical protein